MDLPTEIIWPGALEVKALFATERTSRSAPRSSGPQRGALRAVMLYTVMESVSTTHFTNQGSTALSQVLNRNSPRTTSAGIVPHLRS